MNIDILRQFFGWSAVINMGIMFYKLTISGLFIVPYIVLRIIG